MQKKQCKTIPIQYNTTKIKYITIQYNNTIKYNTIQRLCLNNYALVTMHKNTYDN
jgi:hypothetical protein